MGTCCSKNSDQENEVEKHIVRIQSHFRGAQARKSLNSGYQLSEHLQALRLVSFPQKEEEVLGEHAPKHGKKLKEFPTVKNPGFDEVEKKKGKFVYDYEPLENHELPFFGAYEMEDGSVYEGQWEFGKRQGRGIQLYRDGSIYEGYWDKDCTNGKGRLIHHDGDVYEGDWQNDNASGIGEYIHNDGTTYHGSWRNDKQV